MEGKIYFLATEELARVKIGWSSQLTTRLKDYYTHCPVPLKLMASHPAQNGIEERAVHKHWAHLRTHGEWFRLTNELRVFIEKIAAGMDVLDLLLWEDFVMDEEWPRAKGKKYSRPPIQLAAAKARNKIRLEIIKRYQRVVIESPIEDLREGIGGVL